MGGIDQNVSNIAFSDPVWRSSQIGSLSADGLVTDTGSTARIAGFDLTFDVTAVPEPSGGLLFAGFLGVALFRRRRA